MHFSSLPWLKKAYWIALKVRYSASINFGESSCVVQAVTTITQNIQIKNIIQDVYEAMEQINYFGVLYSAYTVYLEHGRWYSAGFVDILVCVGDAVILDTTEWVSSGGVDTAPTARLNAAIAEIRAQCEGLLPNNHWKTEAQFKYGVNYFRSKHKYTHTLTRFCIFLFYSSLFSATDEC